MFLKGNDAQCYLDTQQIVILSSYHLKGDDSQCYLDTQQIVIAIQQTIVRIESEPLSILNMPGMRD